MAVFLARIVAAGLVRSLVGVDHGLRPDWQALADRAGPDRDARSAPAEFTDLAELELLLAGLSVERREAIVLTQVLGFSYAEAALICRCPIGTIRSRVARAREDLVAQAEEGGHGKGRSVTG